MQKLLWLWKSELERIGKLQWWEQVTGVDDFPKEPTPWHFHPVGLIGNFSQICDCINIDRFIEEYKKHVGARQIINGTDKARIFAEYAVKFEKLLNETK